MTVVPNSRNRPSIGSMPSVKTPDTDKPAAPEMTSPILGSLGISRIPRKRLRLSVGNEQVPARRLIEQAVEVAATHVTTFQELLPDLQSQSLVWSDEAGNE